jgi:aspartate beta-hydroxylase
MRRIVTERRFACHSVPVETAGMAEDLALLQQNARQSLMAGDFSTAQALLHRLVTLDAGNLGGWLNLAAARRQQGDIAGALLALQGALRVDPRNFPALLMNATLLERSGQMAQAAQGYGIALVQAPPDSYLDAATLEAVRHARQVHARHTREARDFIHARIDASLRDCAPAERRRVEAFVDLNLRTRRRFQQEPMEYFYPGLPAIEYWERVHFPWLAEFEAQTDAITAELRQILADDQRGFRPYIHYDDHLPLDQWRELNHSPRWSAFHLFERGVPVAERVAHAPRTMQAISRLPQADVPLRSPAAFFSVLQPHTRIPPHTGVANFRLIAHLPLVLPGQCGFRVGAESREWRLGEAWVFDDTIEHEAWNDSDQIRVILICDIWNPLLSDSERQAIRSVLAASDAHSGIQPDASI